MAECRGPTKYEGSACRCDMGDKRANSVSTITIHLDFVRRFEFPEGYTRKQIGREEAVKKANWDIRFPVRASLSFLQGTTEGNNLGGVERVHKPNVSDISAPMS